MLIDTGTSNNFKADWVVKSHVLEDRGCPESTVLLANDTILGNSYYSKAIISFR